MELIRGLHNLDARHRGSVLSIGNYDGVHRGHQALLARLGEASAQHRLPATVMIFEPTPREWFARGEVPRRVLSLRDKLDALAAHGVARVLIARFDARLAAVSAEAFVREILLAQLGMKAVIVGDDFRFGARRAGDFALLQALGAELGFAALAAPTVMVQGQRCSSTALRAALAAADLDGAQTLLGRRYAISGRVRHGLKLARALGMPTANLPLKRLPPLPLGVYAVRASVAGRFEQLAGVAAIGIRPTIGGTPCLLETHLFAEGLDLGESLYGATMRVEFHRYLRREEKFDSLEALKQQMLIDADQVRHGFAAGEAESSFAKHHEAHDRG